MKSNKIYDIYILSKNLISNTNVSINSIHMLLEILRKRFLGHHFVLGLRSLLCNMK